MTATEITLTIALAIMSGLHGYQLYNARYFRRLVDKQAIAMQGMAEEILMHRTGATIVEVRRGGFDL